jgi:hypothetical protein
MGAHEICEQLMYRSITERIILTQPRHIGNIGVTPQQKAAWF